MSDPRFLSIEEVLDLHQQQLVNFGGGEGLRDRGALESAVSQPAAMFGGEFLHQDLFAMAAAYAFHIAQNQPFVDGNKRAALHAATVFLILNGAPISDPDDRLYNSMIAIAERTMDKAGLAAVMRDLREMD